MAQQGLFEIGIHLSGAVEHMVEPIAQQAGPSAGHQTQHHAQGQVAGHGGFDRRGIDFRRGNHLPGQGALGNLELKVFFGFEEGGKVVVGDQQFLLQGLVLLDQLGLALEGALELGLLALGHHQGGPIGLEGAIHSLELVLAQHGHQPLPAGLEALHHRGAGGVLGSGFGELLVELGELL